MCADAICGMCACCRSRTGPFISGCCRCCRDLHLRGWRRIMSKRGKWRGPLSVHCLQCGARGKVNERDLWGRHCRGVKRVFLVNQVAPCSFIWQCKTMQFVAFDCLSNWKLDTHLNLFFFCCCCCRVQISRESIDACKNYFRDDLQKTDWQLMIELKKMFQIL